MWLNKIGHRYWPLLYIKQICFGVHCSDIFSRWVQRFHCESVFLGDIVDVDVMYPTRQSGQRGQTAHCTQDERSGHGAVEAFRCPWVLLDNHSLFSRAGCVLLCHAIFYICYLGHGYFFPKPLVLCVCAHDYYYCSYLV